MKKSKILILGSNSFAGSNFADFCLTKKHKVFGISRSKEQSIFLKFFNNKLKKNYKFEKVNLNSETNQKKLIKLIQREKIDIIVNFAAQGMVEQSWLAPQDWYKTNILSSVLLLNKIKDLKHKFRFINFSTPEVYGSNNSSIKENQNLNPTTPYALSRATFDQHLTLLNKFKKFPVIITRTANIFGPHQQLYRIVPKAIISFLMNKKIYLDGKGRTVRSFIYMDDVSDALYKICFKGKIGKTYFISTNKYISIYKLVRIIGKKMNAINLISLKKDDRLGKDFSYKLSPNFLTKDLRWKENTNLEDGIDITIDWVKKNFNKLKTKKLYYIHKK